MNEISTRRPVIQEAMRIGGRKVASHDIKEGVLEAMKFFTTVKTCSLPWPV